MERMHEQVDEHDEKVRNRTACVAEEMSEPWVSALVDRLRFGLRLLCFFPRTMARGYDLILPLLC